VGKEGTYKFVATISLKLSGVSSEERIKNVELKLPPGKVEFSP
jgi:hypothetical protein